MLHLEITKVVLIYWNIFNNGYQKDFRALYAFVLIKSFGQLLDISPKDFIFLKIFVSEFSCIAVWFTYRNSKPLEMKDKIKITQLLILKCKM